MDAYEAWLREVLQLAGEIYFRRVEAELWKVAEALDQWLHELFAHPRPDWREGFDQLLAQQEAEGRMIEPKSRQDLLDFLEGWAATIDWNAVSGDPAVPDASENLRPMDAVAAALPKAANRTDEARRVDGPFIVADASRPDTKVAATSPATKPRLPADSRGTWIIGKKGNGVFQFNDSFANRQAGIAGARIRFERNYIAKGGFPPEAYYHGNAAAATVPIESVTGTSADATAADAAMRTKLSDPGWQRPRGYRWHHAGGPKSTTMELVKAEFHVTTAHKGPAAGRRAARRTGTSGRKNSASNATETKTNRHKGKAPAGKGTAGKGVKRAAARGFRPAGTGVVSRGMTVIAVYLTVPEALQAAGILQPDYHVFTEAQYYFVAEDKSVFIVWSGTWFSRPKREFVAGPRKGQEEKLTKAQFREFQMIAEEQWGKYIPGTIFREPRFIPGKQRSRIPFIDPDRGEVGWIDENGVFRNPLIR